MNPICRRDFLRSAGAALSALTITKAAAAAQPQAAKPNVILCMADDQGWGDVGYNGHKKLRTPSLDRMAREGLRFDRFYSGAPVCSPTRGSCLTGRHPYRYGIWGANKGRMQDGEVTLAEVLKGQGYATGHFGKWHLGTLTTERKDSNRGGPGSEKLYAPPWDHGFDICFSTEAKVPTWDPMKDPETGGPYGTYYWRETGRRVTENLEGDDSRIIMDRALPFIRDAAAAQTPFLAVIWFHAPHKPIVSGPPYTEQYDEHQEYYGCITALDEQVGRLRVELDTLGIADDTMLWYASDNGPERETPGSSGPFRDRKRSLHEGGVRVPGLLVWPGRVKTSRVIDAPCSTSDYFPTVLDALGYRIPEQDQRPYDGVSLLDIIDGGKFERSRPIGFESKQQVSLTGNRYKLYSSDSGKTFELYDLVEDPSESNDIAQQHPGIVGEMKATLKAWRASCKDSFKGKDYE